MRWINVIGIAMFAFSFQVNAGTIELANQYGCTGCHAVNQKVLGPSFQEVAEKYQGDSTALNRLVTKVTAGGKGVWGPIAMPAQSSVPQEEMKKIVAWILGGAKAD